MVAVPACKISGSTSSPYLANSPPLAAIQTGASAALTPATPTRRWVRGGVAVAAGAARRPPASDGRGRDRRRPARR